MRDDQYQRLQALTEKLMDVFLTEADPENWPGLGILPNAMDKETRGNRYWCKKDAAATLTLNMRAITMIDAIRRRTPEGGMPLDTQAADIDNPEDSIDKEIDSVEKEAARLMAKLQKKGLHPQA